MAGAVAGSAAVLTLHPFDVIKTRLQGQQTVQSIVFSFCCLCSVLLTPRPLLSIHATPSSPPASPAVQDGHLAQATTYRGTLDAVRSMYQREGWRAFYNGLVPAWIGNGGFATPPLVAAVFGWEGRSCGDVCCKREGGGEGWTLGLLEHMHAHTPPSTHSHIPTHACARVRTHTHTQACHGQPTSHYTKQSSLYTASGWGWRDYPPSGIGPVQQRRGQR